MTMSSIAGELITERLELTGSAGHGVRPAGSARGNRVRRGRASGLAMGQVPRGAGGPATMIVGVHRLSDETLRLYETRRALSRSGSRHTRSSSSRMYVAGCERASESACPPNRRRCSVSRRVGSWPSPWGFRHPDVYGAILCASPGGGYRPTGVMPSSLRRAYLVAGTLEPFFETTPPDGRPRFGMPAPKSS